MSVVEIIAKLLEQNISRQETPHGVVELRGEPRKFVFSLVSPCFHIKIERDGNSLRLDYRYDNETEIIQTTFDRAANSFSEPMQSAFMAIEALLD